VESIERERKWITDLELESEGMKKEVKEKEEKLNHTLRLRYSYSFQSLVSNTPLKHPYVFSIISTHPSPHLYHQFNASSLQEAYHYFYNQLVSLRYNSSQLSHYLLIANNHLIQDSITLNCLLNSTLCPSAIFQKDA
jgi:hypothetical protein